MGLYTDVGYLNFDYVWHNSPTFTFIVGGRGTGKTYGALKYVIDNEITFVYMRRTQTQLDIINNNEFSPFRAIDQDITTHKINHQIGGVYSSSGERIGYTVALSTISNVRGFSASDIECIIYDEFIPEKHERPIKEETSAFLNAYETINRNRELEGWHPVRVFALANSNRLDNPLFTELGLIPLVEKQIKKNRPVQTYADRGIMIVLLTGSRISEEKSGTALYQIATAGYKDMALGNDFSVSYTGCRSLPLIEYVPLIECGGFYMYRHKSGRDVYVTRHKSGTFESAEIEYFKKYYRKSVLQKALSNRLYFDCFDSKANFIKTFDLPAF